MLLTEEQAQSSSHSPADLLEVGRRRRRGKNRNTQTVGLFISVASLTISISVLRDLRLNKHCRLTLEKYC